MSDATRVRDAMRIMLRHGPVDLGFCLGFLLLLDGGSLYFRLWKARWEESELDDGLI
jgi:hypothetical protein